jgi:hypothetical protein
MSVPVAEVAVVCGAHVAAKREAGARKIPSEADVEGDIRVVGVHVEPEVLAFLVLHHE